MPGGANLPSSGTSTGAARCVHVGAGCGREVLPPPDREPVWHEGARPGEGNGYQGPDDDSGAHSTESTERRAFRPSGLAVLMLNTFTSSTSTVLYFALSIHTILNCSRA